MPDIIKKCVTRYIVPFYFDNQNKGYAKILNYFRNQYNYSKLGLPKDSHWIERGFWENYKSDNAKQTEMDIYTYLLNMLKECPENSDNYETNLGVSLVLKTNGSLLDLQYRPTKSEDAINFKCTDLGILIFRNGIGFVWYDIKFSKEPDVQTYVKFQSEFKELARMHQVSFYQKKGKNNYELFYIGNWLTNIINSEQMKIQFWAEQQIKSGLGKHIIPDKAILFQYLFVNNENKQFRNELAFEVANGYDFKYQPPNYLNDEVYEPFGNTGFYASKAGISCIVSNNDTNEIFFMDNFRERFIRDYFFIYVMLLYQTYSCEYYSKLLMILPADAKAFGKNEKYIEFLETIDSQINLFLVKSIYETVSNVQHQNEIYQYIKSRLCIENNIKSLTIGLEALRGIEKEKRKEEQSEKEKYRREKVEEKDRALNKGLIVFGFLVVISAVIDALNLVDWFTTNFSKINLGHVVFMGVITLLTVYMFIILIVNTKNT
jgi:hypothetical protein